MNKNQIIITLTVFLVTLIILYMFISHALLSNKSSTITPTSALISPTGIRPLAQNLYVVSTNPANGGTDIPLDTSINVEFNKIVSPTTVIFSLSPPVSFQQSFNDKQVIIQPNKYLTPGTLYIYSIDFPDVRNFPQVFSFTTLGPTPTLPTSNSYPQGMEQEFDTKSRQERPDVYLANHTPYETGDFSIKYEFKTQPKQHFAFNVVLKNPDKNKARSQFIQWLYSLQLTDPQIQSLDITYE